MSQLAVNVYDLVVVGSGPAGFKRALSPRRWASRSLSSRSRSGWGARASTPAPLPRRPLRKSAVCFSGLHTRGRYGLDYSLREGLRMSDLLHRKETALEKGLHVITRGSHILALDGSLALVSWDEIPAVRCAKTNRHIIALVKRGDGS